MWSFDTTLFPRILSRPDQRFVFSINELWQNLFPYPDHSEYGTQEKNIQMEEKKTEVSIPANSKYDISMQNFVRFLKLRSPK
ncbi:hypothetical protein DXA74_00020 [Bacteroides sp. OF04-15BH]|nr:hypothetical protein DXA74_00020 [Bacteroides sp. OF04-15BH]